MIFSDLEVFDVYVEEFNFKIMISKLSGCLVESQTFLEMFPGRIDVPRFAKSKAMQEENEDCKALTRLLFFKSRSIILLAISRQSRPRLAY